MEDANSLNSQLGSVLKAECLWIEAMECMSTQHLHLGRLAKTLDLGVPQDWSCLLVGRMASL